MSLERASIAVYLERQAKKLKRNGGARSTVTRIRALASDIRAGLDMPDNEAPGCPVTALIGIASRTTGFAPESIKTQGKREGPQITRVRQAVALAAHIRFDLSHRQIGRGLGYAENTAAREAVEQGRAFRDRDPDFARLVETLLTASE